MGKNLAPQKTIIIKGDESKFYDEVIFVMKETTPDLILADKIINKIKGENIIKVKMILECIFYFVLLILILLISIKILSII